MIISNRIKHPKKVEVMHQFVFIINMVHINHIQDRVAYQLGITGGFSSLNENIIGGLTVKQNIDNEIYEIKQLLDTGFYNEIVYSCNNGDNNDLGTGIFNVNINVRKYIVNELQNLNK